MIAFSTPLLSSNLSAGEKPPSSHPGCLFFSYAAFVLSIAQVLQISQWKRKEGDANVMYEIKSAVRRNYYDRVVNVHQSSSSYGLPIFPLLLAVRSMCFLSIQNEYSKSYFLFSSSLRSSTACEFLSRVIITVFRSLYVAHFVPGYRSIALKY